MQKILISRSTLEQLYLKPGLTTVEIARRLGVSQSAVSRRLSEHGIATRTMADYHRVDIPADKLRQLYWDQNLSPDEIAVFYHCSPETILHRIHDAGVSLKPTGWQQMRRYVPDSVLNAWPSPELSYVVGLVASDGNLRGAGNSVSLTSVDRELVEIYLRLLQVHGARIALHHTSHKDQYTVAFSDPVYRAFLEARGLRPNKSTNIGRLNVPDDVFVDFARGNLDGDGCWSVERTGTRSCLAGEFSSDSPAFLEWMRDVIERLAGLRGNITGVHLRYRGAKGKQLGEWLYYNPDLPCLLRKRAVWERGCAM